MNIAVKVHFMHESGKTFIEIAKEIGGTAKDAAIMWSTVEKNKAKFKAREKVVYRKRMTTSNKVHSQFAKKVKEYVI